MCISFRPSNSAIASPTSFDFYDIILQIIEFFIVMLNYFVDLEKSKFSKGVVDCIITADTAPFLIIVKKAFFSCFTT